jgi:hypothetical protein
MDTKTFQQTEAANAALAEGQPFDEAVTAAFQGNEAGMRQFIREMRLDDLRVHFRTTTEKMYSAPMEGFFGLAEEWRKSTSIARARQQPIVARPDFIEGLGAFIRLLPSMKQNEAKISAMVIEEIITSDIIEAMTDVDQRNRTRGLLYMNL